MSNSQNEKSKGPTNISNDAQLHKVNEMQN